MKRTSIMLILLLFSVAGFSQVELDYSATPKAQAIGMSIKGLSPESAQFLSLCRQADTLKNRSARKAAQAQLRERYGVQRGKVSAIVELAEGHNPQELRAYGVSVNSSAGGILTVRIPVKRFAELAESGICKSIDVGRKMTIMMDNVRGNLGIDDIHAGLNLPHGYDGSGVVVGVLDIGMQFCHPSFYDTTGTVLRVKRVWNQKDSLGTAPSGFDYGSEYTTEAQMMAAFTDDSTQTHGSHTTGIAAGCGAPSGNGTAYRGIAPGADIVLVPCILTGPCILDGINYVYNYAHSVGKPCVINMSFGSIDGPHDGTEAYDRFVTSFVQQHPDSFALVCSAGNDGSSKVHIGKQFTTTDTVLTTRLSKGIVAITDPDCWVDMWCDGVFRVGLTLVNPSSQTQEDFTGFFTAGVDTLIETYLITNSNDSVRCRFQLYQKNSYNQSYQVSIMVENESTVVSSRHLILTVMSETPATLHAWCGRFTFEHSNLVTESVEGDAQYTVGGFGANTDAVISVGSYVTRKSYNTYTGSYYTSSNATIGDISTFSSLGPTRDGRVKPDIAAPGQVLMAPYNQPAYAPMGYAIYDTTQWNGQINHYGSMSGTSMSCPVMTGVVALWMQQNPSLGIDSVRAIVHRTARNDSFTGSLADNPSNTWGYGKVNAYGGLPVNATMWLVSAYGQDDLTGCVNGGGVVTEGVHTLTAVPNDMYLFVQWEDGVTDNPRTVNVTCDTTFIAIFEPIVYDNCDTIRDYPWTAEFDENFTCWKLIDADGDGKSWQKLPASVATTVYGVENPDNWLVAAPMEINAPLMAKLALHGIGATGTQDCSLLLSISGSEATDFTTVLATHTSTGIEDFELTASLNEYQGQVVRLAVRHHNVVGSIVMLAMENFVVEPDTTIAVPTHEMTDYKVFTNGLQLSIRGAEEHSLQIYDMMGRLLVNRRSADGTYQLPAPGVYILRVDGFRARKVVVAR